MQGIKRIYPAIADYVCILPLLIEPMPSDVGRGTCKCKMFREIEKYLHFILYPWLPKEFWVRTFHFIRWRAMKEIILTLNKHADDQAGLWL